MTTIQNDYANNRKTTKYTFNNNCTLHNLIMSASTELRKEKKKKTVSILN